MRITVDNGTSESKFEFWALKLIATVTIQSYG
jgi:hypothetical protein